MAHCMLRSIEIQICSGDSPRSRASGTVNRIITSGPQHSSTVLRGSNVRSRSSNSVTTPTLPIQPGTAAIDRRVHDQAALTRPVVVLVARTTACRASGHRTADSAGQTAAIVQAMQIAGRSGARPIPPATSTTSRPMHSAIGQLLPNGPRSPSVSPTFSPASVRVTLPATRIVWAQLLVFRGSPLIEIAISPAPGRYSMLNWPGRSDTNRGRSRRLEMPDV